jgi:hypothetical protein
MRPLVRSCPFQSRCRDGGFQRQAKNPTTEKQGEEEGAHGGASGTGVRALGQDPCAQGQTRRQGWLMLEDLKDMGIGAIGSRRKMYAAIHKLKDS